MLKDLLKRVRTGVAISVIAHIALITWGIVSFVAKPLASMPIEVTVDTISDDEFTKITAGQKKAPKAETPKPVVEKIAEPKQVEDTKAKVTEKKEIVQTAEKEAPPPPPKPEKPQKAEPPKVDQIAEALKKEELKKEEPKKPEVKKAETKPTPPKPPVKERDFNTAKIAALLDKRAPQRQAAAGDVINATASLGSSEGRASQLSATYLNGLVNRLRECWKPDASGLLDEGYRIPITVQFKPDGSLAALPQIDARPRDTRERALAEGVVRALIACQPYTMLPRAKYEDWKELPFAFCTREDGQCARSIE